MQTTITHKAIFLDRDGVLIHNRSNYVRSWEDVRIYPFTFKSLACLAKKDYKIFILTNQSAVGRGLISSQVMNEINSRLIALIHENGGRIDGLFTCPHSPQDNCDCRKPKPGLILQAKNTNLLDLENSWLIGDALTDLKAGENGGVQNLILVKSGRGKKQVINHHNELAKMNFFISNNLWESTKLIP